MISSRDLAGTPLILRVAPRIQSGDYPFLFESMMAGLGVALLPRYAVWQQIGRGEVVEVLPRIRTRRRGRQHLHADGAEPRSPTLATRTLMDFIRARLESQAGNWIGRGAGGEVAAARASLAAHTSEQYAGWVALAGALRRPRKAGAKPASWPGGFAQRRQAELGLAGDAILHRYATGVVRSASPASPG
ncbi:LysR substrate-binding domain-containing protein [Cupriavidus basilensis]